jgi:EmrB/QacA subfamily drug resistance transporter
MMVAAGTRGRATNPWLVLLILCLGFFMIMLDTTIVNVALPAMLGGLHASLDQIVWVINAYLLAYSALLIPAGRLGDIFGQRNLFMAGLVIFTLASVACGISQNPGEIIAARVVQGAGGALLTPQTLTIIAAIFPVHKRGAALGVWGSIVGLSTVVGPTIGGVLVTDASWRWIFLVNVPIGVIALLGAVRLVPDLRLGRKHNLDLPGVVLVIAGLFLLVFGLAEGQRYDWGKFWGPVTIPEAMIVGAIALVALVAWERRAAEPLLPPPLFRNRNYSVLISIQVLIAFGMLGIYLPLVLVLQSALGMTALRAGLTLVPLSLASMVSAPIAGKIADRIGAKYLLMTGIALFALGAALIIPAISTTAHLTSFVLPLIIGGFGLGMCLAPLTAEAMRQVQPQQLGAASGVLNTTRQVGGLIGTAVVTAVVQGSLVTRLTSRAYSTAVVTGLVDAAKVTMWVPVGVLAFGAVCCLLIRGRRAPVGETAKAPAQLVGVQAWGPGALVADGDPAPSGKGS